MNLIGNPRIRLNPGECSTVTLGQLLLNASSRSVLKEGDCYGLREYEVCIPNAYAIRGSYRKRVRTSTAGCNRAVACDTSNAQIHSKIVLARTPRLAIRRAVLALKKILRARGVL